MLHPGALPTKPQVWIAGSKHTLVRKVSDGYELVPVPRWLARLLLWSGYAERGP